MEKGTSGNRWENRSHDSSHIQFDDMTKKINRNSLWTPPPELQHQHKGTIQCSRAEAVKAQENISPAGIKPCVQSSALSSPRRSPRPPDPPLVITYTREPNSENIFFFWNTACNLRAAKKQAVQWKVCRKPKGTKKSVSADLLATSRLPLLNSAEKSHGNCEGDTSWKLRFKKSVDHTHHCGMPVNIHLQCYFYRCIYYRTNMSFETLLADAPSIYRWF